MSYSGNPALGLDAQKRILGTFEQTLDLAAAGNRQEALLGCDFVLRMDPQFEPARTLQARLNASAGPIDLGDLRPGAAPPTDDLGLGFLPDLDSFGAEDDLRSELEQLAAERRFAELVARAQGEAARVGADPALGALAAAAQEKLEAAPFVAKFLTAARTALGNGQVDEALRHLDKARSLDADHPEIAAIEAEARGGAPEPASFFDFEAATAPPAATAMPTAQTFASESDRRIAQLLGEGQEAFERGDPQAAIDSWSRIFLIDIDHEEAARRIEGARRLKAESERQVEEIFHDGLNAFEAGNREAARAAFDRVLGLQPNHMAAREQLDLLESGQGPAPRQGTPTFAEAPAAPLTGGFETPTADLKEEILVPPEGAAAAPRRERKERPAAGAETPAAAPAKGKRTFLLVGAGVLVLVLAAAGYLFLNRDRFFPNSEGEIPTQPQTSDAIARAKKLHDTGKADIAIAQLKRIPATDPLYAEAQKLLEAWSSEHAAPTETAPTPEQLAAREPILVEARAAYAARRYLKAAGLFKQAGDLVPLTGTDGEVFEDAKRQLLPIATQVQLFRDHEWEMLLPQLWRLHEAEPGNVDALEMLIDCYYNLGVRELQRSSPSKALEQLKEAQKLAPQDAEIGRQLGFATTYQNKPEDLLYRIYVKYLRFR